MLPSSEYKLSAPAISDLSWLNPTPHAIAVYASQPLSPVAAQHSLPSGRYPLLGPDFHRLNRTSLRLAHLLDHLIGTGNQRWWDGEAERLRSLQIDHQLKLGGLLNRKVSGFGTLQNFVGIQGAAPEQLGQTRAVGHEAAGNYDVLGKEHRRQPVLGEKVEDPCDVEQVKAI